MKSSFREKVLYPVAWVCCVGLRGFMSCAPSFLLPVVITVHRDYTETLAESRDGTSLLFLCEILQIQLMATMHFILLTFLVFQCIYLLIQDVLACALIDLYIKAFQET